LKTTGYNSVSGDQANSHEVTPKSTLLFAIFLNDFNARRHILCFKTKSGKTFFYREEREGRQEKGKRRERFFI